MAKSRTKGIYKKTALDGTVTYAVRYYVPDENAPNGWKQQQKSFTKEGAAVEFKRQMMNKVKDGDYVPPVNFTIKEIYEKFLEAKKPHLKPQTYLTYAARMIIISDLHSGHSRQRRYAPSRLTPPLTTGRLGLMRHG